MHDPFANMVFLTNAMSNDEMRTAFENNNYSRVPYIDRDSGQVLGILLQRDFYEMLLKGEDRYLIHFSSRYVRQKYRESIIAI